MINVLFFARLREQLGCSTVSVEASQISAQELLQKLCDEHPEWTQNLLQSDILIAINQTMSDKSALISDGDEVAFFPPVTGG